MALERYEGPGVVMMDGSLLAEVTSCRVRLASNNNRVRTMRKGLAGRSKGPREAEITCSNAVPVAGLEQEFVEKVINDADVQIVIVFGGRRYQYDGWLEDVSHNNDTDAAAGCDFTVVAAAPKIITT